MIHVMTIVVAVEGNCPRLLIGETVANYPFTVIAMLSSRPRSRGSNFGRISCVEMVKWRTTKEVAIECDNTLYWLAVNEALDPFRFLPIFVYYTPCVEVPISLTLVV